MAAKSFTFVDICSGAGLLAEGFRQAGGIPVCAVDLNKDATESFNRNIKQVAIHASVSDVLYTKQVDVLVAGPPCQGFSSLGKRDSDDSRNDVALCLVDWVRAVQPSTVVVENVPQFLEARQYAKLKKALVKLNYSVLAWTLNARDFGAAQRRVRSFAIFYRDTTPVSPPPHLQRKTVEEAFNGLPLLSDQNIMGYAPKPSSLAAERFRLIPYGGDKRNILRANPEICPKSWAIMGCNATDVWGRLRYEDQSNTLRCAFQNPSKGRYIHPVEDRTITLREGARLQGIPDSWVLSGSASSIARQIGNGVPISLGKAVGVAIKCALP